MRKLVASFAIALVTGVALTTGALARVGGGNGVGPLGAAGAMRPWSVQYMNGAQTVTQDQAIAAAKSFNVIVALPKVYQPFVAAMKAANPNLQLFVYAKGPFTYDQSLPEAAYSHDALGQRIHGTQYATWLLNPLSSQAVAAQAAAAKALLAQSGYDGVFLDTLGPAALSTDFVSSLPVNPTTGLTWTVTDWISATSTFAGQIAATVGAPTIGNGLRDGKNYFTPGTQQLLTTGLSGGMAEAWLRGATNPITSYPKETVWKQNVDAVAAAGAMGKSFLAVTKVWTDGTQAQKDAWYKFAVASFMLGNDGHSYLTFTYTPGDATVDYPLDHLSLGAPTGPYAKVNNVYQRSFTGGRVLVNPTTKAYAVALGGTFHLLDGTAVTSVTLAPNTAEILTT
jgi:hypothetical protein